MSHSSTNNPRIAIVGVSALFPGSDDGTGFWRDILAGRDLVTDVPPGHWLIEDYYDEDPKAEDKTYSHRGAFLNDVSFDPMAFGVPPTIVPATDTAQLLALIVAQRVLDDAARGQFAEMDKERISVVLGVTSAQELLGSMVSRLQRPVWTKALRDAGLPESKVQEACERIAAEYVPWQESTFPGLLGNVVAGRIANRLDLGGTNCVTDAACASTLSALSMGINELQLGQSDLVVTGGVDTMNDIFMYMCFSKTPALSPTGDCRPFSDRADGTLLGEGIAMFALKRLEDAERDGDNIYALIAGVGSSSDGRAKSVYAPRSDGQARALRRAYEDAGYGPETVELVEAHGTGTKAGDVAEVGGLKSVFSDVDDESRPTRPWCALGSVKSQVGHTKAAAGAAGLFKIVMALRHNVLPPTIKIDKPNPKLELDDSPFYLNTTARPWVRSPRHPRRASVSAFGFGGSNFHVTVEEYVQPEHKAPRQRVMPSELFVLGATSAPALVEGLRGIDPSDGLEVVARRSQRADFEDATARVAIAADNDDDFAQKLRMAAERIEAHPGDAFSLPTGLHYAPKPVEGKLAFLFPGQGSQYLQMSAGLLMAFDDVIEPWNVAAEADWARDMPLHDVVFPRPAFTSEDEKAQEAELVKTQWAQPAIAASSLTQLAITKRLGLAPDCVAGHSFGEVTALHAAGAFDARRTLDIARRRGELMNEAAATPGAMLAVSAPIDEVEARIEKSGVTVSVANHNGPKQVVLSGATDAIESLHETLKGEGFTARRLPVATAFHSPIVSGAVPSFAEYLGNVDIDPPRIPVYADATAEPYGGDAAAVRSGLSEQIAARVRFVEIVEAMYASGVRSFLEVGPESVLTRLVSDILNGRDHAAASVDQRGRPGVTALHNAIAKLWVTGREVAFDALWDGYAEPEARKKDAAVSIPINGTNSGKPYPPKGGAADRPAANPEPAPEPVPVAAAPVAAPAPQPTAPPVATQPVASPQPAPAPAPDSGWLAAFQDVQRQTAEVHAAWQASMNQAHLAYLQTYERTLSELGAAAHGRSLPPPAIAPPMPAHTPTPLPVEPTALPAPQPPPPEPVPVAPAPPAEPVPVPVAEPVPAAAPPPSAEAPIAAGVDFASVLRTVIAEKTGYPPEMLTTDMELESDLGIDSIKRVEILASVTEELPAMPDMDPSEMGSARTMGEIVAWMEAQAPQGAAATATAPPAGAPVATPAVAAPARDLEKLMLEVVAESTGYPADMLGLDMDLESDLGIDSIKRVEILATMNERAPELPEADASTLASLRTLGEITSYMGGGSEETPAGAAITTDSQQEPKADAPPSPSPSTPLAPIERFRVESHEVVSAGLEMAGLAAAKSVVVTPKGTKIGGAIVKRLKERGVAARATDDVPSDPSALIVVHGVSDAKSVDDAVDVNRDAFRAARAVAKHFASHGGVFVTVQDTGGDFGLSGSDRAWLGGLPGLAKTAAREWPTASIKAIDVERGSRTAGDVAEAILKELYYGGPEIEVGLRADGTRTTLRSIMEELTPEDSGLGDRSVIVATGGARGVTAAAMIELGRQTHGRFALLGRTPLSDEPESCRGVPDGELTQVLMHAAKAEGREPTLPELRNEAGAIRAAREIRATLGALADAGAQADYWSVDIRDAGALGKVLDEVRTRFGSITALVHGAGVLRDKLIADKTDAQFQDVFDTKVRGLKALLEVTENDPIELLCLFSSIAARVGNQGQSDYAMANEVLNKVAWAESQRRGSGCVVKSIDWGPWEAGMVTPELKAMFEASGTSLIPLDEGARALFDETRDADGTTVELVLGGVRPDTPLLTPGGDFRPVSDVWVSEATHPYLRHHTIKDVPVLPVVMVLEWFTRVARALGPEVEHLTCNQLKVLKGAPLEHFSNGGDRFTIFARKPGAGADTVELALRGADDSLHYTATASPSNGAPDTPSPILSDLELADWSAEIYGGALFHGPDFQVIESVDGIGGEGIAGVIHGTRHKGWVDGVWRTDVAALDGGLQLAVLWTEHVLKGKSLPTSVGAYHGYLPQLPDEPLHCVIRGQVLGGTKTRCDISFTSVDGRAVAKLEGVETHLLPS